MWKSHRDPDWPLPDRPDHPFYDEVLRRFVEFGDYELFRETALNDFWFYCRYALSVGRFRCEDPHHEHYGKPWLDHPWLFARCRELQADPNGFLDLWPRYHFKTTLITQCLTLWDLSDNPDLRFAFITFKLDTVGEGFLVLIMREAEDNDLLKFLFPDTFWQDPIKESPQWTQEALLFKRQSNAKEPTIKIASLKSTLTSFHVHVRVWDDLVTEESVRSSDAIDDTMEKFQNFAGIAADFVIDRATGTHWAVGDAWEKLLRANRFKLRYHDLYQRDGTTPVLRSSAWCEQMHRDMTLVKGESHWMCVMRNKPELGGMVHFELPWLRYYDEEPLSLRPKLNVYILIDTAKSKLKDSDFTVLSVIGLGGGVPLGHYYLLDLVRDRIGLVALTEHVFRLVAIWRPTLVFIEEVAAMRDSEHIRDRMDDRKFEFDIFAFEDKTPKVDRIKRMQPVFKAGRFHLPRKLHSRMEGRPVELVDHFIDTEYRVWTPSRPSRYDDLLDNFAQLLSPKIKGMMEFPLKASLPFEGKEPNEWKQAREAMRRQNAVSESFWAQ